MLHFNPYCCCQNLDSARILATVASDSQNLFDWRISREIFFIIYDLIHCCYLSFLLIRENRFVVKDINEKYIIC